MIHGAKANSYYFSKDSYANMLKNNQDTENKAFLTISGAVHAVHTDLYDGGKDHVIPFDKITTFFNQYLK